MDSDDLSELITPHHSADSGPTPALSSEEPARYGQGVILTWDPETFANTVQFRGTTLVNLPVMAGTDALTFVPGDRVGIMFWAPAGGSGVYWILPRIIVPGSGAAAQAIAALTTDLGRAVAAAVFADRILSESDAAAGTRTSASFGDLTGADPGPIVADVEITEAGRALVMVTALVRGQVGTTAGASEGVMSVEVAGATTIAPDAVDSYLDSGIERGTASNTVTSYQRFTALGLIPDLNPGLHTFTARYAGFVSGGGTAVQFTQRNLTVIAF